MQNMPAIHTERIMNTDTIYFDAIHLELCSSIEMLTMNFPFETRSTYIMHQHVSLLLHSSGDAASTIQYNCEMRRPSVLVFMF